MKKSFAINWFGNTYFFQFNFEFKCDVVPYKQICETISRQTAVDDWGGEPRNIAIAQVKSANKILDRAREDSAATVEEVKKVEDWYYERTTSLATKHNIPQNLIRIRPS